MALLFCMQKVVTALCGIFIYQFRYLIWHVTMVFHSLQMYYNIISKIILLL